MLKIPKPTHAAVFATFFAMAIAAGCFPSTDKHARAPVVDADAPDAETAYWRARYVKNRSIPPREFAVAPRPARNNDFGEFNDTLYAGLDSQPSLPGLPGGQDIMPMMGGPAGYPVPAALAPEYRFPGAPANRAPSSSVSLPGAAGAAAAAASGHAGIPAGSHFYPIEQLVFGGDYPDIDKPELYRLMPRDVITVAVRDHPEFSGKLDIQADGTVHIPNTHDLIRLRGLAVDEAAEEIRRNLQVYVKGECVVRVQANRARGGYYFVFGDVNQPGRFPMGLEPVKLSDAILAANWEANPNRMDQDDELGPAFPAAGPRGKFIAPQSADLARVMLITPHRSQPVRTMHDVRSAMLGMTNNDPAVRPGQIIVVPSLDPRRNRSLGLDMPDSAVPPDGLMPGRGFSGADSPARLPEVSPDSHPNRQRAVVRTPAVEANMTQAFREQSTVAPFNPHAEYREAALPPPPPLPQAPGPGVVGADEPETAWEDEPEAVWADEPETVWEEIREPDSAPEPPPFLDEPAPELFEEPRNTTWPGTWGEGGSQQRGMGNGEKRSRESLENWRKGL